MGDTGSLAFGGALAGLAVVTRTEACSMLIAGVYVLEALSRDHPDDQLQAIRAAACS